MMWLPCLHSVRDPSWALPTSMQLCSTCMRLAPDSACTCTCAGMAYHAPPVVPLPAPLMPALDDHGAGSTVGGVGGPLAALLEANYALLNQFKANMAAYKARQLLGPAHSHACL